MVSTRNKKQQNRRLFSQLSDSNANFLIGQKDHEAQIESRANTADRDNSSNNTNCRNQVNGSQVDMQALEKNIVSKVRIEEDSVMTVVETRVQDAVMTAIENLLITKGELATKSVNASSGHGVGTVV